MTNSNILSTIDYAKGVKGTVDFKDDDGASVLETARQRTTPSPRRNPYPKMNQELNMYFNTNTKMIIMKIFGRTLKEYLWPVKYYVLGSVLVVISQYAIALPLEVQYPFLLNVTQGLWAGMVALSITTLIRDHGFSMKNVLFTGVLFCFIIHGLKISIRYVFYGKTVEYLIDRFLYGSLLVMCIPLIIGPVLIYFRNKGVHI